MIADWPEFIHPHTPPDDDEWPVPDMVFHNGDADWSIYDGGQGTNVCTGEVGRNTVNVRYLPGLRGQPWPEPGKLLVRAPWWRRVRCRLAIADVETAEIEWKD